MDDLEQVSAVGLGPVVAFALKRETCHRDFCLACHDFCSFHNEGRDNDGLDIFIDKKSFFRSRRVSRDISNLNTLSYAADLNF